ncbi:MAG: nuclear transport factor 2 family protein [Acidimicrobiia bacterium]
MTATAERNRDVIARFLPALVHDDTASMRPLVHDDVVWWVPASAAAKFGLARPLVGWDTIDWFGGNGWKAFVAGSSVLTVHHLVAEGDLVSAHYRRTAERIGADGSAGGAYDAEYNILFRLVDGRIAEVWEVADTAAAFGSRR